MNTATATRPDDREVFVSHPGAGTSRAGSRAGACEGTSRTDRGTGSAGRSAAAHRCRAATRRPPERVRRTRVALALLAAVLVLRLLTGWGIAGAGMAGAGADRAGERAAPAYVVVGQGDTLWDLLRPHTPAGTDHAVYVAQVVEAGDLDPRALVPGTVVRLP